MTKNSLIIILAFVFTWLVPGLGYIAFGFWPALLFLIGYLSGFILWVFLPSSKSFIQIKFLYWVTFVLFVFHRIEEKVSGFFAKLSEMTGVATPEITSVPVILLLIVSIGAWLAGPYLYSRGFEFGHYLVWTFFASMGITELAHFVFPLFTSEPYGYFPGMLTVVVLAPVAWYSMWRLAFKI